ncbi:MAG: acyl-CoA dehydratase activase-related protein [Bacteroidales bacterium]|jgi:predicted CoA-substrate-specific enzyme activase|nr:acyl-CoA dehydratase activase-related protein [Bacteroidales bacterium]
MQKGEKLPIYRVGIDVGSTTIKMVFLDEKGDIVFFDYRRHNADLDRNLLHAFLFAYRRLGNCDMDIVLTGSVGMGIAERFGMTFVQEVVASVTLIHSLFPDICTFIDIGGEDAKMIFLEQAQTPDIRMNGSCAGGTGAFIDQMASLLGVDVNELSKLADQAENIYPIASRCGVFSKTDIQNLISRNVSKNDIAASVFNAVAMQVLSSLSRGFDVKPKVFFCGGPFAFIPALRRAFMGLLSLNPEECVFHENAEIIPAWGCAITPREGAIKVHELRQLLKETKNRTEMGTKEYKSKLPRIFKSEEDFASWKEQKNIHVVERGSLDDIDENAKYFLGIDSGSTTTKVILLDEQERVLFNYYTRNEGDPLESLMAGLETLQQDLFAKKKKLTIAAGAVTGYGENLLKAAYNLDFGMIETMAHYMAARKISPNVSFILDIGGQDMKAAFIDNGAVTRLEINEACSSGCGSFIEGFANMLNYPVAEFAQKACFSKNPYDLGTRCTVFMNSKVKQAMREGAEIEDIAAGLSYSVVKNCLYKVLKLKDTKELGDHIVVQGGAFRNLSILRALELLTEKEVSFSDMPELMGAFGAALYAKENVAKATPTSLESIIGSRDFDTNFTQCKGCENGCYVKEFRFANGNSYYSGNKCEKIYSNKSESFEKGANLCQEKCKALFSNRKSVNAEDAKLTIGIPRGLNMYENYPFWHALLSECGIRAVLSNSSTDRLYEKGLNSVMSDNICFPAKLMHGHILDLVAKKVDRIFFPYVVYEKKEDEKSINSYNCPVVSGYADVLKGAMSTEEKYQIPIDAPTISFNDKKLLYKACRIYLESLGVDKSTIKKAFEKAVESQQSYYRVISSRAKEVVEHARKSGKMVILLAGRPYHADPLVQHKISDSVSDMGVDVITEDVVRFSDDASKLFNEIQAVSQWAYPNRIFKAASYVANSEDNIHYVQLTSFGCGPDAFIIDEVGDILKRKGKALTILKIDDVNNIGSLSLRVRSMVESLQFGRREFRSLSALKTPPFQPEDRCRKIIAPYFAEGYSEFLPSIFKLLGIDLEILPPSNSDSVAEGLKYANNEICYPATLVIGDIIKALKSGKYHPDEIAVAITQTGGQCRATNYISLLKKAMLSAGFDNIPVVSVSFGSGIINEQPGFELKWHKALLPTFFTLLYADVLTKFYYAAAPREIKKGEAERLRYKYIDLANPFIEKKKTRALSQLLKQAAEEFNQIIKIDDHIPAIGVVGEIYVKYNSFSHKNILQWLSEQGVEVIAPSLYNFFLCAFQNAKIRKQHHTSRGGIPIWLNDTLYNIVYRYVKKIDKIGSKFRYYRPFANLERDAQLASRILNLSAQFGEGWLIPAELASFAEQGVYDAVSLQPFGCIANHVISKGIEKQVKKVYPEMQMLFIDFDADSSEANVLNRLHFMVKNAKEHTKNALLKEQKVVS